MDATALSELAHRFFYWGSFRRADFGGAPELEVVPRKGDSTVSLPPWLERDVDTLASMISVSLRKHEPPLWMLGENYNLWNLRNSVSRGRAIDMVLYAYPKKILPAGFEMFRLRRAPKAPLAHSEYDSPPSELAGKGRFDAPDFPVLYASPDIELCVHECRVTAEDELFVATLEASRSIQILDLTALLPEWPGVSEQESLDIAVHLLFLAGSHSYSIANALARAAGDVGLEGIQYPSYFSALRTGTTPLRATLGYSNRRVPHLQNSEQQLASPNIALFGRPLDAGTVSIKCVNRLRLEKVSYGLHFGPAIQGDVAVSDRADG